MARPPRKSSPKVGWTGTVHGDDRWNPWELPDGSMLLSDDSADLIYRITWRKSSVSHYNNAEEVAGNIRKFLIA